MKVYKINVNGKSYEVEVETISEKTTPKEKVKEEIINESTTNILAPMQGTITKLNIKVGSEVKKGDVLMVLEAMKLENDILCPIDGYVRQLLIKENQKVELNQLMLVIG
ncbi:MAG: acetyl-CoA carboxylase biotin carboxyl carrier protein subunit [Tenericutes bacterium HGW-Tenericutes-6]|nr:MAG: acetyl-CoA carboxylase biotin carboxyl carrier protein subunit [Tenericutes bacterium HGW-Tenericutes-6]